MLPEQEKIIVQQFKEFVNAELAKYKPCAPTSTPTNITPDELLAAYFGCMVINSKGMLYMFSKDCGDLSLTRMKDIANNQNLYEPLGYRFTTTNAVVLCEPPPSSIP